VQDRAFHVRLALVLACLAAVHGGLLAFLYQADSRSPFTPDSESYVLLGSHLATSGRYSLDGTTPSARREPLYPLLVAFFVKAGVVDPFTMSARNLAPLLATQIAIYLVAVGLVAVMARRQSDATVAGFTAVAAGLYVPLVQFVFEILPEVTFILLVTLLLVAFLDWHGRWSWRSLVSTAVLAGLAGLIKAPMVFFPLALAAFSARRAVAAGRVAQVLVLLTIGLGLPAAWTARNASAFGSFILSTVNGGSSFYRGGLILGEQIPHVSDSRIPLAVRTEAMRLEPHAADAYLSRLAFAELKSHPGRALLQAAFRFSVLLFGQPSSAKYALLFLVRVGFLAIALLHLLRHARPLPTGYRIVLLYCIYLSVLYSAVYTTPRYFASCSFLLVPWFVAGARDLIRSIPGRRRGAAVRPRRNEDAFVERGEGP
jgi:hypothetical protein